MPTLTVEVMGTDDIGKRWAYVQQECQDYNGRAIVLWPRYVQCAECHEGGFFCEDMTHASDAFRESK